MALLITTICYILHNNMMAQAENSTQAPPLIMKFPRFRRKRPRGKPHMDIDVTFRSFITDLALDHNVDISPQDGDLYQTLHGAATFQRGDGSFQFEMHGICVESPKNCPMPFRNEKPPSDVVSFRYGPKQRLVYIDPERLTPLGVSVLMWVLVPGERCSSPLVQIMEKVGFGNCFMEKVAGKKEADYYHDIVVPLGWTYALRLETEFLLENGEFGDMCILMGGKKLGEKHMLAKQISGSDDYGTSSSTSSPATVVSQLGTNSLFK